MFSPYNGKEYSKECIENLLTDYRNGKLGYHVYNHGQELGKIRIEKSFEHGTLVSTGIYDENGEPEYGLESIMASQIEFETGGSTLKKLVDLISEGAICGFFTLSAETGPRALCARSILADVRYPDIKDRLNRDVKHREMFRPFAPVVMHERGNDYFVDYHFSPYMLETFDVKKQWREKLPAITHIDGSSRLQSVKKVDNPVFYRLLEEYSVRTGIHILLNTSFNLAGEPVVESPFHALACFLNSNMDILYLDGFLVRKKGGKFTGNSL